MSRENKVNEKARIWKLKQSLRVGRRCDSCKNRDGPKRRFLNEVLCFSCYVRGRRNGWCACGTALVRSRGPLYGRKRSEPRCPWGNLCDSVIQNRSFVKYGACGFMLRFAVPRQTAEVSLAL